MLGKDHRILQLALLGLEVERQRIETELQRLRDLLGVRGSDNLESASDITADRKRPRVSPNKGVRMSAAQKKKISATMKARWLAKRGRR